MLELLADSQIWSSVQIVQGLSDPKPPFGCAKQTNWQIPRSKNKTETNLLESENKVLAALPKKKVEEQKPPRALEKVSILSLLSAKLLMAFFHHHLWRKDVLENTYPYHIYVCFMGVHPKKTYTKQQNNNKTTIFPKKSFFW